MKAKNIILSLLLIPLTVQFVHLTINSYLEAKDYVETQWYICTRDHVKFQYVDTCMRFNGLEDPATVAFNKTVDGTVAENKRIRAEVYGARAQAEKELRRAKLYHYFNLER